MYRQREQSGSRKSSCKVAKIVKLMRRKKSQEHPVQQIEPSTDEIQTDFYYDFNISSSSSISPYTQPISLLPAINLYIIRDYKAKLIYGDLSVRQGEVVRLICDLATLFNFVENSDGQQGFVPKDICVDLEHMIESAHTKDECQVTSL